MPIKAYDGSTLPLNSFESYAVLDVETTTSRIDVARVVSLSLVVLLRLKETGDWLSAGEYYVEFDPGEVISPEAAKCHGISAPGPNAVKFETVAAAIASSLTTAHQVVGWSINDFILPILNREYTLAGLAPLLGLRTTDLRSAHAKEALDPLTLAYYCWKGMTDTDTLREFRTDDGKAKSDTTKMARVLMGIVAARGPDGLVATEVLDTDGKLIKRDNAHWFTFGKYDRAKHGALSVEQLIKEDGGYLSWLESNPNFSPEFRTALGNLVNKLLTRS